MLKSAKQAGLVPIPSNGYVHMQNEASIAYCLNWGGSSLWFTPESAVAILYPTNLFQK